MAAVQSFHILIADTALEHIDLFQVVETGKQCFQLTGIFQRDIRKLQEFFKGVGFYTVDLKVPEEGNVGKGVFQIDQCRSIRQRAFQRYVFQMAQQRQLCFQLSSIGIGDSELILRVGVGRAADGDGVSNSKIGMLLHQRKDGIIIPAQVSIHRSQICQVGERCQIILAQSFQSQFLNGVITVVALKGNRPENLTLRQRSVQHIILTGGNTGGAKIQLF